MKNQYDPNGSVIDQTFDDLNRLTRRDITRGAGVLGVTYETFDYDGLSRMISASNNDSSVGMLYDTLSRLTDESQQIGGQSVKYVASEYDNVGNREELTYPSGKVITIVPDNLDRISQIKDSSANIIAQYAYVGPFRVAQRDYLNGTKLNVAYDANRRITGFEHALSGTAFAGFTYAYDKENNKLFEKRTQDNNNGDAYVYDSIYRLTGVKYGVPNLSPSSSYADYTTYANKEEFTLDGVGNRTQLSTDLLTTDYLVNNLNQYYQINSTPHSYDANGNLKDDGTNLYFFDYLNRLMEVKRKSDNVSIVTFVYDALGRRIQKVNNLQTTTVNYYYDMGSVIEERDGNDATTATFVFGNEILQMSVPVSSILHPVSGDFYYHANTQGSIYAVTDNNGDVVERYKYEVYGKPTILAPDGVTERQASVIGNTRLFVATEYDSEVGLYNNQTSNYSPILGRNLQGDAVANDALLNPYTYANNNSVDVMPTPAGMPGGSSPYAPTTAPSPGPGPYPQEGESAPTPTPQIPPTGTVANAPVTPQAAVGEMPKECELTEEQKKEIEEAILGSLEKTVADLVKKLGDDDWRTREEASKKLKELIESRGKDVVDLLEDALVATKDAEVIDRIERMLIYYYYQKIMAALKTGALKHTAAAADIYQKPTAEFGVTLQLAIISYNLYTQRLKDLSSGSSDAPQAADRDKLIKKIEYNEQQIKNVLGEIARLRGLAPLRKLAETIPE